MARDHSHQLEATSVSSHRVVQPNVAFFQAREYISLTSWSVIYWRKFSFFLRASVIRSFLGPHSEEWNCCYRAYTTFISVSAIKFVFRNLTLVEPPIRSTWWRLFPYIFPYSRYFLNPIFAILVGLKEYLTSWSTFIWLLLRLNISCSWSSILFSVVCFAWICFIKLLFWRVIDTRAEGNLKCMLETLTYYKIFWKRKTRNMEIYSVPSKSTLFESEAPFGGNIRTDKCLI